MTRSPGLAAILLLVSMVTSRADQVLPGYTCMTLNQTHDQLYNRADMVPIFASPGGPKVGLSGSVVFVRQPSHIVHGYAEILRLNGQPGWIARDILKPMSGHCTPMLRDNGRPEIGP